MEQGIAVFDPDHRGHADGQRTPGLYLSRHQPIHPKLLAWLRDSPFMSRASAVAFDPFGNGKTMVRGGWGMYRNHDNWNVRFNLPAAQAQGVTVTSVSGGAGIDLKELGATNVAGTVGTGNFSSGSASANNYVVDRNDR